MKKARTIVRAFFIYRSSKRLKSSPFSRCCDVLAVCSVADLEVLFRHMRREREAEDGEEAKEFHGKHQWFANCYRISPATRVLN